MARNRLISVLFFGIILSGCGGAPSPDSLSIPERAGRLLSATQYYGPLFVREGQYLAESGIKPWSSWWYPRKETTLFDGSDSPLEKYDQYVSGIYSSRPSAADFEKNQIYDPNSDNWEGLCDAWAMASISVPEPALIDAKTGKPTTVKVEGVSFTSRDLKALVIKTFETLTTPGAVKHFGERYYGRREDPYDDIYPDQFHRVLQAELFDRGRPIIMDSDPGIEVWNTPIWKASIEMSRDGDPHIMHVHTAVVGADPKVDPDMIGRKDVIYEYTYDLYGYPQPDGSLKVAYGVWTGDSVDYHPDFVTVPPEKPVKGARASSNTAITTEVVDELVAKAMAKLQHQ